MQATAVCIPAERPQHFERIVNNIAETTPESHAVYWMVGTDESEDELKRLGQTYWRDNGDTWGNRANYMFTQTTEPYLFIGSDDSLWHEGWLSAALNAMSEVDGVVFVKDGLNPAGTLPLVSRHYINESSGCVDEPGVIFSSAYSHAWTETELKAVAQSRGRFNYCPESFVEHLHVGNGRSPDDEIYRIGAATMGPGEQVYQSRRHLWQ